MRLEGSHPALLATQSQSTRTVEKRQPISKWSADTPLPDPASRRPSAKAVRLSDLDSYFVIVAEQALLHQENVNVASRPKKVSNVTDSPPAIPAL